MTGASATFARLAPDSQPAHAALKAARELVRAGDYAVAADVLAGPHARDVPLAALLRADLLLAMGRPEAALTLAEAVAGRHGDTGQGALCAGHARLALGDRQGAADCFARAAAAAPGRIAARVNAVALAGRLEAAPAAGRPAAAVTSLPPGAGPRCRQAMACLAAAGFSPLISVNDPDAIDALAGRFPEVAFVASRETAQAVHGRACVSVAALLAAGAASGAPAVAVVNADIVLCVRPDFAVRLAAAAKGGALTACRVDSSQALPGQPAAAGSFYYDVGFDLCAVDAAYAVRPELEGYYLGLPWWDYALPLAVARQGGALRFCPAPILGHARHGAAWSHRSFLRLGRDFAARFWPEAAGELLAADSPVEDGGPEALLAALGGRTAALLRRAPDAGLWDVVGFCPHDPAYAAAALPLTRVDPDQDGPPQHAFSPSPLVGGPES
jgi:hypothetical protein